MAQGEFTKEEAYSAQESMIIIIRAMPNDKLVKVTKHFAGLFLFIDAAIANAPEEVKK